MSEVEIKNVKPLLQQTVCYRFVPVNRKELTI